MFTINPIASDYCGHRNLRTLSWNKNTDCCSWDRVQCDETMGQVIELYLFCSGLQGKFHTNSSLFQSPVSNGLSLSYNNFSGSLISPKFGELSSLTHHIQGLDSGLKNLTQLRGLYLDSVNISSTIPLNFSPYLTTLQLSGADLREALPERVFDLSNLEYLSLSSNSLTGAIPSNLQGPIPKSLLDLQGLYALSISQNNLSGQIASAVCNLKTLTVLDLGSNHLNGTIPQCLGEMSELQEKVPPSLINCRYLEFLDLGNNELNDTFPNWLGCLPYLRILCLGSNKLHGPLKDSRRNNLFAQIRVIDLSSNGFSGKLPVSLFENFQAMKIIGENSETREYIDDYYSVYYMNTLIVTTKGWDREFFHVLTTNIIINFSRNRFEGYVPSIGDLVGLRELNLSHNGLEGVIATSLQCLSVLELLDLSSNKIGGEIPQQLVSLTFLVVLDLSHNHLVGCIPKGKQFDTFDNSSYQGNDGLRGLPLSKDCGGDDGVPQATTPVELDDEEEEEGDLFSWQAVLMGFGCGLVI
ncbi:putative serine/threonine-protein phosphatase PP2A catalytic subunit-like isoform 1 [Capsicum annuum]|uniref:Leucine-rich repeat-containing N-terminal plant-type domain-containing protein n=1 Tax=Capsicum annuum TaxID=4072 RepID=A0A2G3AMJ5_CAPAN|nr:putative serine/threonine-protein phosphatase PP2A catalytic subunit-like isoform 1 [Capsicum annuum]KAF3670750.1 putative serine/threonine-protein phosphatase PP2A catalytic subunit-like isoform 1 [Capsicum annuum]PHT95454.1 hypothetical protein T459_03336 [Capsicum annuum]